MTLGLPARAQRALDAVRLRYWLLSTAEWVPGHNKVRVVYEKPSGEELRFEFHIDEGDDSKIEEWIEGELIRRLREYLSGQSSTLSPDTAR